MVLVHTCQRGIQRSAHEYERSVNSTSLKDEIPGRKGTKTAAVAGSALIINGGGGSDGVATTMDGNAMTMMV